MNRYYLEIGMKDGERAREELMDLLLRYGSRGNDSFESLNDCSSESRSRRVILETPGRISLDTFVKYSYLEIRSFEEAGPEKITVGFETSKGIQ